MSGSDVLAVKNPVREERGILAFSRKVKTRLEVARDGGYGGNEN